MSYDGETTSSSHKEATMKYEKLTPATFRKKLKDGGYGSATGARRAVGKAKTWTEKEKESARRSIDKHFDSSEPAPKTTKKPAAAKKKTSKKASGASNKPRRSKPGPVEQHHARKRAAKEEQQEEESPSDFQSNPLAAINLIKEVNMTAKEAVDVMRMVKESSPSVDISSGMQQAQDAVTRATAKLRSVLSGIPDPVNHNGNGKSVIVTEETVAEEIQQVNFEKAAPIAPSTPIAPATPPAPMHDFPAPVNTGSTT